MIKEGNVSASEARRQAAKLNGIKVRKRGDAQRILLMNLVKDGNISLALALKHAKRCARGRRAACAAGADGGGSMGVDLGDPEALRTGYGVNDGKIYNFVVDKIIRFKGAQERVLQLDFQRSCMANVHNGEGRCRRPPRSRPCAHAPGRRPSAQHLSFRRD